MLLLLMFLLSCFYVQQIRCYSVHLGNTNDSYKTRSSPTKPSGNYFNNPKISTLLSSKGNEPTSAFNYVNGKIKRETIKDPLEGDMSYFPEVSGEKVQFSGHLSNFKQAIAEESPYSVMLFVKTNKGIVSCTGTLLTLQWVLSAASCLWREPFNAVVIYAGGNSHDEWLNQTLAEGSQERYSLEYHYHPSYYKTGHFKFFYNVLVVKADPAFTLTKTVAPVPLSTSHVSFAHSTNCKITSFGRMDLPTTSKNYFRKTQHLTAESPCLCFDEENAYYWICPEHNQPLSLCTGDIGVGLICDGKVKAFLSHVVPARDAHSCDMRNPNYYDCFRVNNTINVFQGTCPYLRFINQYVKLFSSKQIENSCDLEPQESGATTSEHPEASARTCSRPSFTVLNVLIIIYLLFLTNYL